MDKACLLEGDDAVNVVKSPETAQKLRLIIPSGNKRRDIDG